MSRWSSMNLSVKFSTMYNKLLEESPLGPVADEAEVEAAATGCYSPAAEYRKSTGFRIRKSVILAVNLVKLVFSVAAFIYIAVLDVEAVSYEGAHLKKAQIVLLIFIPFLSLIQLVGLIGILREKILLVTIYWTFSLLGTVMTFLGVVIPIVIDFEDGDHWKAARDLLLFSTECTLIGWYLYDLYQVRGLRKLAVAAAGQSQLRPMATVSAPVEASE